jgi:hypothetical protein
MKFTARKTTKIRLWLRRLFRRTPPQAEKGWVHLPERAPSPSDSNFYGLVDVYRRNSDSSFQAYTWSLRAITRRDSVYYYWKKIAWNADGDRHFKYFVRSRSVLG